MDGGWWGVGLSGGWEAFSQSLGAGRSVRAIVMVSVSGDSSL